MLIKKFMLIISAALTSLCIASIAFAAPFSGQQRSLKQPDGTSISVRLYGDEFYTRMESLDGFTLIRDNKTQWICYAKLDSTKSKFVSTGVKCISTTKPRTLNIEKGLIEKSSVIAKKVKAQKDTLGESAFLQEASQFAQSKIASTGTSARILRTSQSSSVIGLTILIDFPDEEHNISRNDLDALFNQDNYTGFYNHGSVKDYFSDMSNGNLTITHNVPDDYYEAQNPKSYYDAYNTYDSEENMNLKASELIHEALVALDGTTDFSQLTLDEDNKVVSLSVLYTGTFSLGSGYGLYPHKSGLRNYNLTYTSNDSNKTIIFDRYMIKDIGDSPAIGSICHEICHSVLGYGDTYDRGFESFGTGNFDIMSGGPDDKNPLPVDPYHRNIVSGFASPAPLNNADPASTHTLTPNSFDSYIFSNPNNQKEYFLIECIDNTVIGSRREEMPGSGLLIWHINEDFDNNNNEPYYKVSVEQADGMNHLENDVNMGHEEDFFYHQEGTSHKDFFCPYSSPGSTWWDGTSSNLFIENVNEDGTEFTYYPSPPANFRITNSINLFVQFSWDGVAAGTNYAIYRKYHGTDDSPVKVIETENTDETLISSYGSYDYFVAIVDSAGNRISGFSPPVIITNYSNAPSNLSITNKSGLSVYLSWEDVGLGTGTHYAIYRKYHETTNDPEIVKETINTIEVADTLYGSYDFFVAIVDSDGNRISQYSNSVTVDDYLPAPSNFIQVCELVNSTVAFSWDTIVGATRYGIFRRETGTTEVPTLVAQSSIPSKNLETLEGDYDYFVAAVDPDGNGNRISLFSSPAITVTYHS